MDVVVIVIVLAAVAVMIFKKFTSFVYYICSIDIFLKIINFISDNMHIKFIDNFVDEYIPNGMDNIIRMYTDGIFTTVLIWIMVLIYGFLCIHLIKLLLKK